MSQIRDVYKLFSDVSVTIELFGLAGGSFSKEFKEKFRSLGRTIQSENLGTGIQNEEVFIGPIAEKQLFDLRCWLADLIPEYFSAPPKHFNVFPSGA